MRQITRRSIGSRLAALAVLTTGFMSVTAFAQGYPNKPIRLIVPWPAGGSTDVLGRALGVELGKQFGQPVIIENRAGAAGKIGTTVAAKSPPDGYTIYLGTIANFSVAAAWEPSLQYDPAKDFAPVAYVADSPAMLAVKIGRAHV